MREAHQREKSNGKGYLGGIALALIIVGLYWGLIQAPPDAFQGEVWPPRMRREGASITDSR